MAEQYRIIDMNSRGPDAVEQAFANQVAYCASNGAKITARICAAMLGLLRNGGGGPAMDRVHAWQGAPLADALPLRVAGGLHALHLSGREPSLGPAYRGEKMDIAKVIEDTLDKHAAFFDP